MVETIPLPFLACDFCGRNTQAGWMGVNVTLAQRRKLIRENYANGFPIPLPIPPLVIWEILHDRCAEKLGKIESSADEYRIDSASIRSTNDILALTADLMKKDWLAETTWRLVLRRIIADTIFQFDLKMKKRKRKAASASELVKAG